MKASLKTRCFLRPEKICFPLNNYFMIISIVSSKGTLEKRRVLIVVSNSEFYIQRHL